MIKELNETGNLIGGHDVSDGGLAIASSEICIINDIGIKLENTDISWLFGESQGLYLLVCKEENLPVILKLCEKLQTTFQKIGTFGGDLFAIGDKALPLKELKKLHKTGLDCFF